MSTPNPLGKMGGWRGLEGAIEITVPLTAAGVSWFVAYSLLSQMSPGRPFTTAEVWATLAVCVGITSWALSRQLYLGRKRKPTTLVVSAGVMSIALTYLVASQVSGAFESGCTALEGELVGLTPLDLVDDFDTSWEGEPACRVGGVVDNPYLVGSLLRPSWNGVVSVPMALFLIAVSLLTTMGLRTFRVRPTQMSFKLARLLRYAPAAGSASVLVEPKPKNSRVVACNNATLWGETCGQIYAEEKEWYPGEWCTRCQQGFTPAPRRFHFKVVSLFTGDVDVLNGIERIDTVSWNRGQSITPDARLSGQERWVVLGTLDVPDVITVAQLLALVHELLPQWADTDDTRIQVAGRAAVKRASRVAAWIWRGTLSHRLTYARPNNDVVLAIGPRRLRDLIEDSSEELWLQLDVGLLPIELRTGFRKTFVEEGRAPELQNSKFDIWVPVANPSSPKSEGGVWVPRVEGDALRSWLSLDQLRDERVKGVSIPLPYLRYDPQFEGEPPEGHDKAPRPGSLDFVRYPLGPGGMEPTQERAIGASTWEWDWMEWRQIELLRQEVLVLESSED